MIAIVHSICCTLAVHACDCTLRAHRKGCLVRVLARELQLVSATDRQAAKQPVVSTDSPPHTLHCA